MHYNPQEHANNKRPICITTIINKIILLRCPGQGELSGIRFGNEVDYDCYVQRERFLPRYNGHNSGLYLEHTKYLSLNKCIT
jgi:hypothetical protein